MTNICKNISRKINSYRILRVRGYRDYCFENHICKFYLPVHLKHEALEKKLQISGRHWVDRLSGNLMLPFVISFKAKSIIDIPLH